jgi:putative ABC transport system permease protein
MGASNSTLLGMILLQALVVGIIGYGSGVGAASLFGYLLGSTELAFRLPWQLLGLSAAAITLICMLYVFGVHQYLESHPARAGHCL